MTKRAIITGAAGQDGSYLSEYLLSLGYDVYGVVRRTGTSPGVHPNLVISKGFKRFHLVEMDITDHSAISSLIVDLKPDEFYNLAAQSHVGYSFENPVATFNVDAVAVINMLQTIRQCSKHTRFYQASTSELFGVTKTAQLDEADPFSPRSPYAVAKLAAHSACVNFSEMSNGIFASCGILFNHSSPRRPKDFATRKITSGLASYITKGTKIRMGNLDSVRDIGHSREYVVAMHKILNHTHPDTFVIATGVAASIRDIFEYACGLLSVSFEDVYERDERFMRPSDVPYLLGNPQKAKSVLNWSAKTDWRGVIKEMLERDTGLSL